MRKDEEEFIKRISEIIDSIKKGECTFPIKEVPEGKGGEGQKIVGVDHHKGDVDAPSLHRGRSGSTKQTASREETPDGGTVVPKDQTRGDSYAAAVVGGVKCDKKDVATSMSPMSSLESSRPRRRFEVSETPISEKTPVMSQSSNDSVSCPYTVVIVHCTWSFL